MLRPISFFVEWLQHQQNGGILFVGSALSFLLFVSPELSAADHSVSSETSAGSHQFTEQITYFGSTEAEKRFDPMWIWDAGYTFSHSSFTDPTTNKSLSDNSHELTLGVGWRKRFEVGGGFTFDTIPNESITDVGPNFYFGYDFELPPWNATIDDHRPVLKVKGNAGFLSYTETFDKAPRRNGSSRVKGKGSVGLVQTNLGASTDFTPWSWNAIDLSYNHYFYNKNIVAFSNLLDSAGAIRTGAANLNSSIIGFASDTYSIDLSFYIGDLTLEPSVEFIKTAVAKTWGQTIKAVASYTFFDKLEIGAGYERDMANNITSNLGIGELSYDF